MAWTESPTRNTASPSVLSDSSGSTRTQSTSQRQHLAATFIETTRQRSRIADVLKVREQRMHGGSPWAGSSPDGVAHADDVRVQVPSLERDLHLRHRSSLTASAERRPSVRR